MQRSWRYGLLFLAFVTTTLFAVSIRQRLADRASLPPSLDNWDIAELADHLKRMGVELQLRSVPKDNSSDQSAFLTSTDKDWQALNVLNKDAKRIGEWNGTLYCERVGKSNAKHLIEQWGERCLAVGPFLFYGDRELLSRVRDVLTPLSAPHAS